MRGDQPISVSVRTRPLQGPVQVHALDCFKMLRVMKERFDSPTDFDLDEFMRHSFNDMLGEVHTVKVRIPPRPGPDEWGKRSGTRASASG